jgi:Arc/MetJ family transcription regulator
MKPVKKTWLIDPDLVRKAQKACGARTETETVTLALREVLVRDEIDRAFRRQGPILSGLESPFADPSKH